MASADKIRTSNGLNQSNQVTTNLPDEFYPLCWQDDERMDNLFAPFREKCVNPVNYESKMKFWKNLIQEYCTVKGNPIVTVGELRSAFHRNGKKPFCIETVLVELITDGLAKTKSQFMEAPLLTWSGWAMHKLVKTPIRWSFDKVKERIISVATTTNDNVDESSEFVLIEVARVIYI